MATEPARPLADPAAEAAYQKEVWENLPRNFAGHLAHGLFGQTGFRLINAPTFIPAYVFQLSGSEFAVGLASALQALGMFLSPVMGATFIEHRKRVLPTGFVVGALMRLQVLGIALSGLFLPDRAALIAAWIFLALFGFFMGMQGVIFNFLMSKVIPVERRGVLLGLRNFLAGITASAVAYAGGHYLVETNALGNGYAATFLMAFVLTALGLCMLLVIREPIPPDRRAPARLASRLRDLPELLRSDRPFTMYFSARALATMGRMAVPFYILFAGTRVEVSGVVLGQLSLAFLLAQTTTNLAWGWIADRTGFRLIFLLSLVLWILSALLLMQAFDMLALMIVFSGLGAGQGGFMMSSQNLVLEFGQREDLPMRIAVANSASEAVGAVGPLLGGVLAMLWSYELVFWVAIGFQVTAVAVVLRFVDEPRRKGSAKAGSRG